MGGDIVKQLRDTRYPGQLGMRLEAAAEIERLRGVRSISRANDTRDKIAERIWRAEYRRATGRDRTIEWAEVGEPEVIKYLYIADAILQLLNLSAVSSTTCAPSEIVEGSQS